jgi:hypothetical protein
MSLISVDVISSILQFADDETIKTAMRVNNRWKIAAHSSLAIAPRLQILNSKIYELELRRQQRRTVVQWDPVVPVIYDSCSYQDYTQALHRYRKLTQINRIIAIGDCIRSIIRYPQQFIYVVELISVALGLANLIFFVVMSSIFLAWFTNANLCKPTSYQRQEGFFANGEPFCNETVTVLFLKSNITETITISNTECWYSSLIQGDFYIFNEDLHVTIYNQ